MTLTLVSSHIGSDSSVLSHRAVLRSPVASASNPFPSVRPGQKPVVHRNGTNPTATRRLSAIKRIQGVAGVGAKVSG